jgi:hypothetical protein
MFIIFASVESFLDKQEFASARIPHTRLYQLVQTKRNIHPRVGNINDFVASETVVSENRGFSWQRRGGAQKHWSVEPSNKVESRKISNNDLTTL